MRNSFLFFAIILVTGFSSCHTSYRYIYSASPANTPFFIKKGENKLAAYYSTSEKEDNVPENYARGFDLQGAYAITNHWAITADYFNRREKDVYNYSDAFNGSVVQYKRNLVVIGAGYFLPVNKQKTLTANLYGGFGRGKFYFEDNAKSNHYYSNDINKWQIQPFINYMPLKYLHLSFAGKVSFVQYRKTETTYTNEELAYFSLQTLQNRTLTFFEPAINIQFGIPKLPWVKLDMLFSGASNSVVRKLLAPYEWVNEPLLRVRGTNASFGLSFDFSTMKKKR